MATNNRPDDDLRDDIIYNVTGPDGIAAFVGLSERKTYYLLATRQLPGKKLGPKRWCGSKRALRKFLQGTDGDR